ncbi:MAG: DNA repair exonuclease [Fuerstiella sp.]
MSEFQFIHAADIHLDSPLRGLSEYESAPVDEIREAVRRALENLVALAIDQRVSFVLIAGDIYDGDWKDYNTGLCFVKQVTRLQKAGIPVYAISGNHDAESRMTRSLALPANPDGTPVMFSSRKAQTIRLEQPEVAIHGRSFRTAKETENLCLQYPSAVSGYFNIGMLHTALTGIEGHEPYAPCTPADLHARNYQYWALGHVHNRQHLHEPGQTPIVFPGNIQGRHIRETGPKGCELVSVGTSGDVTIQFQPLDVFRWQVCTVDASRADTPDDVIEQFSRQLQQVAETSEGRPLAVRVQITGSTAAHTELVARQQEWLQQIRVQAMTVGSGDIWIEKVLIRTAPVEDPAAEALESGPMAELLRYFDDLEDDEALLREIAVELESLQRKLPDELNRDDVPVVPAESEQLRRLLQQVRPLLIHRLQCQEAAQ